MQGGQADLFQGKENCKKKGLCKCDINHFPLKTAWHRKTILDF